MTTSSSTTARAAQSPLRPVRDRRSRSASQRWRPAGAPRPKPFALLCALARTPHALITKSALLDDVWGHQFVSESVLKTSISDLRAALQDDPKQPRYIETVSRRGYRFIGTVERGGEGRRSRGTSSRHLARQAEPSRCPRRLDRPCRRARAAEDRMGRRRHGPAPDRVGVGRGRRRQDHRPRTLHARGRRRPLRVRALRRAIRRRRAASADPGGAHRPVASRSLARGLDPRGRADLALPAALALVGGRARGPAARAVRRRPDPDAARDGRAPRSLHGKAAAAAGHRGPALERPGHGAARRLPRAPPLAGTAAVARQLPRDGADRGGPPARDGAPGVAPAWPAAQSCRSTTSPRRKSASTSRRACRRWPPSPRSCGRCTTAPTACRCSSPASSTISSRGPAPQAIRTHGSPPWRCPDTLSGVIERYVEELTPEQRSLLEAASVCGVQFRLSTVARVLDADAMALADVVRRGRARPALAEGPCARAPTAPPAESGYVFRHALYREVLYKRVGRLARVELHRKVAAALERERAQGLNVGAAELASHLDLGREPMAALGYYAEAAESALLHFSPAQTLSLTERAMALLPQVEPSAASRGARDDARHLARHRRDAGEGLQLARRQGGLRARAVAARPCAASTRCAGWSCRSSASPMKCAESRSRPRRSRAAARRCGRRTATARRWSAPASCTVCWSAIADGRASHASGWRRESARWRSSMRARRGRCSSPTPA